MRTMNGTRAVLLALALVVLGATGAAAADDDGMVTLHLMWTNDVHGHIAPEMARFMNPAFPPPLGGGASMMTYVEEVRERAAAAGEYVMLLDAGDTFQGTPVGTKTKGEAVVEFFNTIGYDAIVPGNHDFDMGRDNCEKLARSTDAPWICANIVEESTGEVVDWCEPTIEFDVGGLRLGLIGICTPATEHMAFPDNIRGLSFEPMAPTIEHWRDELRADGVDIVGLLIHEGLPYDPDAGWARIVGSQAEAEDTQGDAGGGYGYVQSGVMNLMELVNAVSGIDFAVGGHTHRGYPEPWIDPVNHTMCFESYGNGSSVGHAILTIHRDSGTIIDWAGPHDRGTLVTLFEDELWPHEEMTEALRPYIEMTEAEMGRVIGSASVNLTRGGANSVMGNLVTDAMRAHFDADFSFQNTGGLRADVPAGDITARDVFSVLPFGNELVLVTMKGSMIRRIVERKVRGNSGGLCTSGLQVVFDRSRPDWDRCCALLVNGEPLDLEKEYRVVCTSFLMEGNSGLDFLTTIPADRIELTQITTAEAFEAYIKAHSPVRASIDDRWVERPGQEQAPYLCIPYLDVETP